MNQDETATGFFAWDTDSIQDASWIVHLIKPDTLGGMDLCAELNQKVPQNSRLVARGEWGRLYRHRTESTFTVLNSNGSVLIALFRKRNPTMKDFRKIANTIEPSMLSVSDYRRAIRQ